MLTSLRWLPGTLLASALLSQSFAAAWGCDTAPSYHPQPGFSPSDCGCTPSGYYGSHSLGNLCANDARPKCEQLCTADGDKCSTVVTQVTKGKWNGYTSTCFFYGPGKSVSPRKCAQKDKPYALEGYRKDGTNSCFAKSSASATKYCSSYLSIPAKTKTVTSTPRSITMTVTATASPTVTTSSTVTATTTGDVTDTITVTESTVTSTATVTTTTTATDDTTVTVTSTENTVTNTATVTTSVTATADTTITVTVTSATAPVTATDTASITVTVTSTTLVLKRDAKQPAATKVPAPACVSSDTPASQLSSACSCLKIAATTTTTTTTLSPGTVSTTTTTIEPVTVTATTTVTSATVTETMTATDAATSTVSTTTTETQSATVTETMTATDAVTSTVSITTTAIQSATTTQIITATDSATATMSVTTTITETVTQTAIQTSLATFALVATYPAGTVNPNIYFGFAGYIAGNSAIQSQSTPIEQLRFVLDPSTGTVTTISDSSDYNDKTLYSQSNGAFVQVGTQATIPSSYSSAVCSIDQTSLAFTCLQGNAPGIWYICSNLLNLESSSQTGFVCPRGISLAVITLQAVLVS